MPTIDIGGLRCDYSDTGDGIAVVFVPGLCGSKEFFCYQSAGLCDHYRVISYDLRCARGPDYSLQTLADDLARLLDALRIPEAVVAGHSLGGLVALQHAANHPDRCLALVLSSVSPCYSRVSVDELQSDLLIGEVIPDGLWARFLRWLSGTDRRKQAAADPFDVIDPRSCDISRRTLNARLVVMRESDLCPSLAEIAVPAMVVAGSMEKPYVLAGSQALDQDLPDSSLEVIEGGDQFHFYKRHDVFNSLVADFLSHRVARL